MQPLAYMVDAMNSQKIVARFETTTHKAIVWENGFLKFSVHFYSAKNASNAGYGDELNFDTRDYDAAIAIAVKYATTGKI